jgi:hypothetical protein
LVVWELFGVVVLGGRLSGGGIGEMEDEDGRVEIYSVEENYGQEVWT